MEFDQTKRQFSKICISDICYDMVPVWTYAGRYYSDFTHAEQVVFLSACLFRELGRTFLFEPDDYYRLICGAIVHDIGWVLGQQQHHKTTMQLILSDMTLPWSLEQRQWIALIARYHRKSLPKLTHPVYCSMPDSVRKRIDLLAGIVRMADGLDRTHTCQIKKIRAEITDKKVIILCKCNSETQEEIQYGQVKSDLLLRVLGKPIYVVSEWTN